MLCVMVFEPSKRSFPGKPPRNGKPTELRSWSDLKPEGAVELALAEQIAAKLWRLGRVVRHEADVIAIGQDREDLALAHEAGNQKKNEYPWRKQGITVREDIEEAASALRTARGKLTRRDEAIRLLEALPTMGPDVDLPWEFAEDLMHAVSVDEKTAAKLEKECETNESGFVSRHALDLLSLKGNPEEMAKSLAEFWREDRKDFEKAVRKAAGKYKRTLRRYEAALERLRLSRGLPDEAALDKIQRYEAHLERGFHKALERLQALQEARGAVFHRATSRRWPWRSSRPPPRPPEWLRSAVLPMEPMEGDRGFVFRGMTREDRSDPRAHKLMSFSLEERRDARPEIIIALNRLGAD